MARPMSRGSLGKQRGACLPMVRTASAGADLGMELKDRDLGLRPRRRQSFSDVRELSSSQSAPRLKSAPKEIMCSVSSLRNNMRQKASKRGFRAELACLESFPNRRPISSELSSSLLSELTALDLGYEKRVLERAPGEMSPLRLTPKERNRLHGVSSLEHFLHGSTPLPPEPGGAQCSGMPGDDAFPPPPPSAPHDSKAGSKSLQEQGYMAADGDKQIVAPTSSDKEGISVKPTEEMRKASRSKHSHSKRKVTLGFSSSVSASPLPAPDTARAGPMFPSVKEALELYYGSIISSDEIARWRLAFARFSSEDGSELRSDILHEVLLHLGFLTVTEEVVNSVAKQTTDFSTLDFADFTDFCERWVMYEREALQAKCQAWFTIEDHSNHFNGPVDDFKSFMRSFDIVCSKESVEDIMALAGLTGLVCSSPEILIRFLAGRRARLGFSAEELQELREAFEECEQVANRGPEGQMIKADEISNGILGWAELYCVDSLRKLLSKMEGSLELEKPPGCCFYEFVVCAGQVREMMLHEVFDHFKELDTDQDGFIGAEDLRPLCKSCDFTLVDAEFNEFLGQEHVAEDAWLDFEACGSFVKCVREANGFCEAERDELEAAFNSFCDESGEMPNLGVMDLLEHIGFDNTLEQVMEMVEQVDFNGNGTMDSGEFMRLMRIQRELSIANYQTAYGKHDFGKPDNAQDDTIAVALTECHIPPDREMMEKAIGPLLEEYHAEDDGLTFEAFLHVAETCRRLYPVQKRKRAYFKEEEIALIQMAFAQQDSSQRGFISVGDLVWLLADSGLPVNTKGGRAMIFEKLDKARDAAKAVGIDDADVGSPGSPRVRFMPVVHLVRDILKEHNKEVAEKTESVMKGVKFSADEIAEFRKLFDSKSDAPPGIGSSQAGPKRRRSLASIRDSETPKNKDQVTLSKVIARFKHIARCPIDDVLSMSSSSAFSVSTKQKLQLCQRIMSLVDDARGLDFASFVQVMQWMLDSNYGNLKTSEIGENRQPSHVQDAVSVGQSRLETRRVSV